MTVTNLLECETEQHAKKVNNWKLFTAFEPRQVNVDEQTKEFSQLIHITTCQQTHKHTHTYSLTDCLVLYTSLTVTHSGFIYPLCNTVSTAQMTAVYYTNVPWFARRDKKLMSWSENVQHTLLQCHISTTKQTLNNLTTNSIQIKRLFRMQPKIIRITQNTEIKCLLKNERVQNVPAIASG